METHSDEDGEVLRISDLKLELGGVEEGVVEVVVGDGDDTVETGNNEGTTERGLPPMLLAFS